MIWLGYPQQLAPAGQGQETVAACAEAMASVCDIMQLWVAKGSRDNVGNCRLRALAQGLGAACEKLQA